MGQKLKSIVGQSQDEPETRSKSKEKFFGRTVFNWNCTIPDCWAAACALFTGLELNSETDICLTTIHHALTHSEMQTCHLDVESRFITLAWKKGLHKQFWVMLCRFKTFCYVTGLLMAARDDRHPEALPPEALRNLLLTSLDTVWLRMWRRQKITSDIERNYAIRIALRGHWEGDVKVTVGEKQNWTCEQMSVCSPWVEACCPQ